MKKTLLICCIAITIGLLLTLTTVRATGSDTVFEGNAKIFVDIQNSNSLFGNFNSLYPGCDVVKTILIHNPDSRNISIYIRGRAASKEYRSLLEQVSLSVLDENGNVLSTASDISQKTFIGELSSGQNRQLQLRLHINRKTDVSLKSTDGKIDWIFSADESTATPTIAEIPIPKTNGMDHHIIYSLSGISIISLITIIISYMTKKSIHFN